MPLYEGSAEGIRRYVSSVPERSHGHSTANHPVYDKRQFGRAVDKLDDAR